MILANTGRGKSYFVKNNLRSILKKREQKCLYLLSRVRTKGQFEAELPEDETIKLMTYQAVESIKADPLSSLGSLDVIVADECHYFLSDSSFNSNTDIGFDWIMNQDKAIRIFMTATGDGVEEYLNSQLILYTQYKIDGNYNQIRNLNFFGMKISLQCWPMRLLLQAIKDYSLSNVRQKHILFMSSLKMPACICVANTTKITQNTWTKN